MSQYRALCFLFINLLFFNFISIPAAYAVALESAGRIIATNGTVTATNYNGLARALKRGDNFYQQDTIKTAVQSNVSLQFTDETLLELKENSTFKIKEYKFNLDKPSDDSYLAELVKGGFRTITGILGKRSPDQYDVQASMTTLTVRGTKLMMEFIPAPGKTEGDSDVQVGVIDGTVVLTSHRHTEDITANTSAVVHVNGDIVHVNFIPKSMTQGYSSPDIDHLLKIAPAQKNVSETKKKTTFIEGEGAHKPRPPVGTAGGVTPCAGIANMSNSL